MESADLSIVIPAFFAGLLVLTTHIPLGMKILERGVIFADLAVAQIAGLGVIVAGLFGLIDQTLLVQFIATISALCGALLLTWIEHRFSDVKEACIGLTFVLAASGGILLMSHDVHASDHLKDLLVGQILWVNSSQLSVTAILSLILVTVWKWSRLKKTTLGFYALFAVAVTASVQLIGVYLVFSSLIVPALSTYRIVKNRSFYAFAIGSVGYGAGLLLSTWFDLPSGAAIIWTMSMTGCIFAFFALTPKIT